MPEHITSAVCHKLRTEIYGMIFPRWALMLVILLVAGMLATLYTLVGRAGYAAVDAMKQTELNKNTHTLETEHVKQSIRRIETAQMAQQTLLTKIDKKIPDNGNGD